MFGGLESRYTYTPKILRPWNYFMFWLNDNVTTGLTFLLIDLLIINQSSFMKITSVNKPKSKKSQLYDLRVRPLYILKRLFTLKKIFQKSDSSVETATQKFRFLTDLYKYTIFFFGHRQGGKNASCANCSKHCTNSVGLSCFNVRPTH